MTDVQEPGYDPDAPPLDLDQRQPANDDEAHLKAILIELARIKAQTETLKTEREGWIKAAVEVYRRIKRPVAFLNPQTGGPEIASLREDEVLKVDAPALLAALIEYHQDEETALVIWEQVLKPREVDTKQGGMFEQVCDRHTDDHPTIPLSVVAQVARLEKKAAFVGFSKPRR